MAIALGMIIPPKVGDQGIATVAAWAREVGLDALDLPQDFAAPARVCRAQGLEIGTVAGRSVARPGVARSGVTRHGCQSTQCQPARNRVEPAGYRAGSA